MTEDSGENSEKDLQILAKARLSNTPLLILPPSGTESRKAIRRCE